MVFDTELVAAAIARGARLQQHRVRRIEVHPDRVVLDGAIAARTSRAAA